MSNKIRPKRLWPHQIIKQAKNYASAQRFLDNEKYDLALVEAEKALNLSNNEPLIWFIHGQALRGLNKLEEAIESFSNALEIDPKYHYAELHRAYVYADTSRYNEAIPTLEKYAAESQKGVITFMYLARCLTDTGVYEQADVWFEKGIKYACCKDCARNYKFYYLESIIRSGRIEKAASLLKELKTDNPNDERCEQMSKLLLLREVQGLIETGCYESALDKVNGGLSADREDLSLYYLRGKALDGLERFSEAEEDFLHVLEIRPDHENTLATLISIYMQDNRFKEAIPILHKYIELFKNNSFIITDLAVALTMTAEYNEGRRWYEKALEKACCDDCKRKNQGKYLISLIKSGRFEEADTILNEMFALNPEAETLIHLKQELQEAKAKSEKPLGSQSGTPDQHSYLEIL